MNSKLYVGNLSYSTTSEQLKDLFAGYGEVKSVNIIQGKGFGFVEMGDEGQAEAAKQALNGSDFSGRTMRVDEARPPKPGGGGGGGGFDRNRGGGDRRPPRRY